ncbi:MAG: lysozyme [Pedobacter sp.]|nr:MAG: lysozyme [Pedobacter sp.]
MKISTNGISFIKNEEKFMSKPYLDAVKVPTIGYGTTRYENGKAVTLKDPAITEKRASELLQHQIDRDYAPAVTKALKVPVTQNQFDALTSFAYNVGTSNNGMAGSTLLKRINAGIKDKATIEYWFGVWNKGTINGVKVVLDGLVKRRRREAALFLKP